jgi:DNA-binding HxlR family transcriptional regulator
MASRPTRKKAHECHHVPPATEASTCEGAPPKNGAGCVAVREVLNRVGDKWSVQLILALAPGVRRFSELKRAIEGISQRMLTLTLRGLERDGLVARTVYPTVPARVEYALTPLGRTLIVPVSGLARWAATHREPIQAARDAFDLGTRTRSK